MIERHDLGETKACEPHEARVAAPSRDVVDELDRRAIAPMEVLGHKQQRPALARAIQKLAHLAQHAICRDTGELPPQSVALLGGAEPRQLQEPGRRDRAQQRHERAVDAAQLRQGFEDGEVGLAAAVLIDALAADAKNIAETRNEMLDQRRLADTRLAGNPDDPAFAGACEHPSWREAVTSASARPMNEGDSAERLCGTTAATAGAATIALVAAMKRYPRRDTVSMKRGLRASSSSAVRSSLIAVRNTESVTNWWPQTSSSNAFVVRSEPGCRTSAHSTPKGVGARATGVPSRSKRAFASSSSNRSKRTRTGFELADDAAWSVRSAT